MSLVPCLALNSGFKIPQIGFGTFDVILVAFNYSSHRLHQMPLAMLLKSRLMLAIDILTVPRCIIMSKKLGMR